MIGCVRRDQQPEPSGDLAAGMLTRPACRAAVDPVALPQPCGDFRLLIRCEIADAQRLGGNRRQAIRHAYFQPALDHVGADPDLRGRFHDRPPFAQQRKSDQAVASHPACIFARKCPEVGASGGQVRKPQLPAFRFWAVIAGVADRVEHPLSRGIVYIMQLSDEIGRPRETRTGDVAILTALDEELAAILRLPLAWTEFKPEADGTRYYEATVETASGPLRLVAATASRMGMAATACLASKMIDMYRPRYLVMAGVTGGVRGRVHLGDILVADPSYDWGSGKYEISNEGPAFSPNPDQLRLAPDLGLDLVKASKDETMLGEIRAAFAGSKPDTPLQCHVEAVASGAAVLGDVAIVDGIKLHNRKQHGIKMEIYGLMMAAEMCAKPRPLAFPVKAVSDFADPTKSDDVRPYALHASANFILRFVTEYLVAVE